MDESSFLSCNIEYCQLSQSPFLFTFLISSLKVAWYVVHGRREERLKGVLRRVPVNLELCLALW